MKALFIILVCVVVSTGCATTARRGDLPASINALAPAPGIFTSGRLEPADVERLHRAGIRHVIDLTPDAETPDFDEAAAVRAAGLGYSNLPLRGAADLTRDNVLAFDALMRSATQPVLVHCASANRVGAMAALRAAWMDGQPQEEAIAIGKAWGLKGLEAAVRERIASDPGVDPE